MDQIMLSIEAESDAFYEFENQDHINLVSFCLKSDVEHGVVKNVITKSALVNWFCKRYFKEDLEISCEDLFDIAKSNNVKVI